MSTPIRGGASADTGDGSYRDLAQRAISASPLAALSLLLTFSGVWPFALMLVVGSVVLASEWARLVRSDSNDAAFFIHAAAVCASCIVPLTLPGWVGILCLGFGAAAAAFLCRDRTARKWSAMGILYLGTAASLLAAFRNDTDLGLFAILFLFMVVWSADTAAYFAGRTFKGPKLAPSISPGKTWAGFTGGMVVPALLSYVFGLWLGETSPLKLAFVGAALALATQVGDLAESTIKRKFKVKDAGNILPGHGGLFDRVDGLIGAVIAAGILVTARAGSISPAALLQWP